MAFPCRYSPLGDECELTAEQLCRLGLESAFGPILIVTIPDLRLETIRLVVAYLTVNSSVFFPPYSKETAERTRIGGGGCPLVIEVSNGSDVSLLGDRPFWTLVCGLLAEPGDLLDPFVHSVIAAAESDGDRLFDRQEALVGEDALYAWFDTCFGSVEVFRPYNKDEAPSKREFRRFHDTFLDYLRVCDMDHEVRQDDYIHATLALVDRYLDGVDSLRLAAFRLTNGQDGLRPSARSWLRRRGMLKLLIDDLLADLRGERGLLNLGPYANGSFTPDHALWFISELIETTYGSDDAGDDVVDYVLDISDLDIRAYRADWAEARPDLLPNTAKRIADADQDRVRVREDTGFHRCTEVDGGWQHITTSPSDA